MNIAVISLTVNGAVTAHNIAEHFSSEHSCRHFAYEKYTADGAESFSSLSMLTEDIFHRFDALIFISACGIAVRSVAPHISSKLTDPAVISVDESGRFAVSLLSGHIGGANALAEKTAHFIGAIPVITTATDIGGKFSPDSFAKANKLIICEPAIAKDCAAKAVNGLRTGFLSDYPCVNVPDIFENKKSETGIYISNDLRRNPFKNTLHLIPRNVVIGTGCKKNTASEKLYDFVMKNLSDNHIIPERVCQIRTIDIKRNEPAVVSLSKKMKIPLTVYTADQLISVQGEFSSSEFVQKTVGVDNVCERCAAYGASKIIVKKQAYDGMTFSAAELPVTIDFERGII